MCSSSSAEAVPAARAQAPEEARPASGFAPARHDFSGRVAVVTGGAAGIGAAVAGLLAGAGAAVAVWDAAPDAAGASGARSCGAGDDGAGGGGRGAGAVFAVDVADRAAVDAAAAATLARFGRIDILVNNAGLAGPTLPLDACDPDLWRRIVEVNLLGVFHACRAVVPAMRRAGAGRIVNIASLAGKEGTPDASAYSAAKAGVLALTKSLGKELAATGILVNAVAPAAVRTGLLDQMSPDHVRTMLEKSPMRRLGEPGEVAETVAWLCSGSCSFSTGAVFDLSGGRATY